MAKNTDDLCIDLARKFILELGKKFPADPLYRDGSIVREAQSHLLGELALERFHSCISKQEKLHLPK